MTCCDTTMTAQRDADYQAFFVPQGGASFAETIPSMRIWNDATSALAPLLSIETTATVNGSVWSRDGDSLIVLIRKADLQALPDGPLYFDITLGDFDGLVNPFTGGVFDLYADGSQSCGGGDQSFSFSLSGQTFTVLVQGNGLGRVMSLSLSEAQDAAAQAQNSAYLAQLAAEQSGSGSAILAEASAFAAANSEQSASASAEAAAISAGQAQTDALAAAGSEIASSGFATAASGSAAAALVSATAAQQAALAGRLYPTATANVPRGLDVATIATPGSGYTNGTFDIATTGGSLTIQGVVRVTVAGGVITAAVVTQRGQYIGGSPVAPTVPLGALGGGTGGSVTVTLGFLIPSGETYLANHASDTSLYQLFNNNSGSPALVAGSTVPKNYNQIYLTRQIVPCYVVAGTTSSNFTIRPTDTNTVLTGTGVQYIFTYIEPFDCNGNENVAVLNGDGSSFLPLLNACDPKGLTPAIGSFKKNDLRFMIRNPVTPGDYPGTTGNLRQLAMPNPAITTLSEEIQALNLQAPSRDKEVFIQVVAERVMLVRHRSIKYDNAAYAADSDDAAAVFYNMGRAQSQSTPQCAVSWAVNSQWANVDRAYEYSQFLSNEGAGANFDREGHSAVEPVARVGVLSGGTIASPKEVGNGHGGLGNTAADFTLELYDAIGFNGGSASIPVGSVVTGLVTGAVGTVYRQDVYSGSFGSLNAVGTLHMKTRSKAFQIGEALRVSGVTRAFATSTGYRSVNTVSGLGVGAVYNCSEAYFRHRYDGYYSYTDAAALFGEVVFTHRVNVDGVTYCEEPIYKVGRKLGFDAGVTQIDPGMNVVNGSGATGTVVVLGQQTGAWGSTRAGNLYLSSVTGTWADNDPIIEASSGDTYATVNGTLGPVIGTVNSYGPLMAMTTVNRAKIAGFNQISIGNSDGRQRPDAGDNYPPYSFTGTWPVTGPALSGSPLQAWHSRYEVPGKTVIMQMVYNGAPMTPPGDFSQATTSKLQIEDRFGGNRKFSINWTSGPAITFSGSYSCSPYTHQFRVGDPI